MRIEIEIERSCPAEGVEPHLETFRVDEAVHLQLSELICSVGCKGLYLQRYFL